MFKFNTATCFKILKTFLNTLETMAACHYKLISATVNFIVYWHQENSHKEIGIVLPKLYFEKI